MTIGKKNFGKTAKIAKFNSISVSLSKLAESDARTLDFYECIDDVDSCLRCDTPFQNCRKHVEDFFRKRIRQRPTFSRIICGRNFRPQKKAKKLIYFPIAVFVGSNTSNQILLFQQQQISFDCFVCNAKFFGKFLGRQMRILG